MSLMKVYLGRTLCEQYHYLFYLCLLANSQTSAVMVISQSEEWFDEDDSVFFQVRLPNKLPKSFRTQNQPSTTLNIERIWSTMSTPSYTISTIPAMRAFINSVVANNRSECWDCPNIIRNIPIIVDDNAKPPSQALRSRVLQRDCTRKHEGEERMRSPRHPLNGDSPEQSIPSTTSFHKKTKKKKNSQLRILKEDSRLDDRWQTLVKVEHASSYIPPPKPTRSSACIRTVIDSPIMALRPIMSWSGMRTVRT